ncbi:MAG TPA: class I SAM-dependent methyltransferase [Candidatus Dormibacteraeota bacterium]|nr:class I SAM-dependent methyltransferase [Candidatus Dormibacteraeota bacterium]
MPAATPETEVAHQYRDGRNLGARQALYHRFGTAQRPWQAWVFDQLGLPDQARILEVGCGSGRLWVENQERLPPGWQVTLSDLSPGMVAEAEAQLGSLPGFQFVVAELSRLPYLTRSFDAVIANHMLYHVPDLAAGLAEIHRVLATNGVLVAATNGPAHLRQLRQLQARIGTVSGPRGPVEGAFNLVTGPALLQNRFGRLTVRRHAEELWVTDAGAVVAYLRSLPGPRLGKAQAEAVRTFVEAQIERRGHWSVAVEAGLIRGRRRPRALRAA